MSIARRLKLYLKSNKISFMHSAHPVAYRAREVAAVQGVAPREMVKTVILKADGNFIMVVLPAALRIDLALFAHELPFDHVELADERELASLFPDCDVGAMPPFGNLYGLQVYVDRALAADDEIVFNAGTHVETIRMNYSDFERLARPILIDVGVAEGVR